MKILVTGNAGFIGYHTAKRLIERGDQVVGFDVVNDYYDPAIKEARLASLAALNGDYTFIRGNLVDAERVKACYADHDFDRVVHLAAQAGVRYSIENPFAYVESNLIAFTSILEASRHAHVPHLTYASTSSVYGANTTLPFSEHASADHPLQFYAATKRANELMAHAYSHLFRLPTTGLRFFTVYGAFGRPDMALFLFTKNILAGIPIKVFNNGNHTRDFTYVEDVVEGVIRASDAVASPNVVWDSNNPDPGSSNAPFRIFNVGNSDPVSLGTYIEAIEAELGKKAIIEYLPLQPGDVPATSADVSGLISAVDYKPSTPVRRGVAEFVRWYRQYYQV